MSIPFSDDDLKEAVLFNREKIKTPIENDGGGIKFINVINGIVYVQLQGACVGCASSHMTIKNLVEKHLRSYIHQDIIVKNVPQGKEENLEEL